MGNTTLQFEEYRDTDEELKGGFVPSETEEWLSVQEEFYDIHDQELYNYEYYAGLIRILNREPEFLDAYAHIGHQLLYEGQIDKAQEYYQKGLDIAHKLIPKDFSGQIPWADLDNRPFLRLHHGYILCQIQKGNVQNALKLMHQHLSWNPNDNIGVRFLVEDTCRQAGITHFKYNHRTENL